MLLAASFAWASTRYAPNAAVQGTTQSFVKVPEVGVPSARAALRVLRTEPFGANIRRDTEVTPMLSVTFAEAAFKVVQTSND